MLVPLHREQVNGGSGQVNGGSEGTGPCAGQTEITNACQGNVPRLMSYTRSTAQGLPALPRATPGPGTWYAGHGPILAAPP